MALVNNGQQQWGAPQIANRNGQNPYQQYQQQANAPQQNVQHQATSNYETLDANGNGQAQPTQGYRDTARANGYTGELSMPAWSDDPITQQKALSISALQSGMSGQNQGNAAYSNLLRDTAAQRIAGLQGGQDSAANQMDTQMQRGFKAQNRQLASSSAGAGTQGSIGYGQQASDLAQKNSEARSNALLALQNQGVQQLGQLSGIGSQLNSQDTQNRQLDMNQGQALSNLYSGFQGQDLSTRLGQQSIQRQQDAASQAALGNLLSSGLGAAGTIGGMALGGPLGAAAGGAIGGGIGGAFGGNPMSMTTDPATLWAMQMNQGK